MLGTLLKHEFKAVSRLLLPLYGAWLIAAVMLGLSIGTVDSGNILFITLFGILYGVFALTAVILSCVLLFQRFYKNLLGNEGYLTLALPVSTGNHIINKILSGAVWGTAGLIVAVLSGLIIAVFTDGFSSIYENFVFMYGDFNIMMEREPSIILALVEILIIIFICFGETAAKIYAAIAVGHQWSNHRVLGAIAAFIGFGFLESMAGNLLNMILKDDLLSWFWSVTANMAEMVQMHLGLLLLIIGTSIAAAIYGCIAWKLLDTRLNLE